LLRSQQPKESFISIFYLLCSIAEEGNWVPHCVQSLQAVRVLFLQEGPFRLMLAGIGEVSKKEGGKDAKGN